MPGPFGWLGAARHKTEADIARNSGLRIAYACTEPGCIFCAEQGRRVDTYFFWYLKELFFEPSMVERMRRSHGFCRRHTAHLLARAGPSTVGRIYLWMLLPLLSTLRGAETASLTPGTRRSVLATLRPTERCEACESEAEAPQHLLIDLRNTLDDPKVRDALRSGPTICLQHFLAIAPFLEWDQLAAVLEAVLGSLDMAASEQIDVGLRERTELVWGRDADAHLRAPDLRPGRDPMRIAGGFDGAPGSPLTWSPTIAELHRLLAEPGCPICHARYRVLHDYLAWLSREIITAPDYQWSDALWLCPTHAWDFLGVADPVAAEKLVVAIAGHWHAQFSELAGELCRRPPSRWWRRFETIPAHTRRVATEHGRGRVQLGSLWADLGPAVRDAMLPPDRVLAGLRTVKLRRERGCPACRHMAEVAVRTGDLLVRSLGDSATLARYEQSSGVCYRDLALAFSQCRDTEQARALARAARVHLEVLEWELHEALRKEAWDARHEPKGPEQSAALRATEQVSGSHLREPTVIGLD